jgi:hypothetical protein
MSWLFFSVVSGVAVGLFWLGYRHPRPRRWLLPRRVTPRAPASAVDRQHRHLAAGGQLGEAAVAATADHFRELLYSGRIAELEWELRPGIGFAVQVQALAAIGTAEAGRLLERQLSRTLSRDPVEQGWYWADIASGLRRLRYGPALPAVLRCVDAAAGLPAAPVLAAEVVAFPNFPSSLNDLTSPVGRTALRAIAVVAVGCREGVIDPGCMLSAGLGDLLATLSETAPPLPDPWLTAVLLEAERVSRRLKAWTRLLTPDARPNAHRQARRLLDSATRRREWLATAPARLLGRFPVAPTDEQTAILRCLLEFRADVTRLFPHLPDRRVKWWVDAIRCLTWSRSPVAGPVLAAHAGTALASWRGRSRVPVLVAALRGQPCPEAERVLVRATSSGDPAVRVAAASALGWWPPLEPAAVLTSLRALRSDSDAATRQAAVAALARLGERAALQEVSAALASEEPAIRAATARRIAAEELSWLWPDLQEAAASADPVTALAAGEATERLREHVLGPLG